MIINPLCRLYICKHYAVDTRRSFTRNQIHLHLIGFNSVLNIFSSKFILLEKADAFFIWHEYHRYLWDFLHHIYSGDN